MNQKGFVNIILIVIVVVLAGVGAYFVLNRQAQLTPTPMPTPVSEAPTSGPITVSGEITCLPKKGGSVYTEECAIGLMGTDDRHYGLKNLFKLDPEYKFSVTGLRVEVSGTFLPEEMSAPAGAKYDVVGIVDVTSIEELATTPQSLTITTKSPLPSAIVGKAYSQTINASGSGNWKLVLKLTAGSLPPGLEASCCLGVGGGLELEGTPTKAGTYTFTITVIDGTKETFKQFTLEVLAT